MNRNPRLFLIYFTAFILVFCFSAFNAKAKPSGSIQTDDQQIKLVINQYFEARYRSIKNLKLEDFSTLTSNLFEYSEMQKEFDKLSLEGARRADLKEEKAKLVSSLAEKQSQLMSPESYEERKKYILRISQEARESGLTEDAPFDIKRRTIKLVVDQITANANEGWVKIEGKLRGTYRLENRGEGGEEDTSGGMSIVNIPRDKNCIMDTGLEGKRLSDPSCPINT